MPKKISENEFIEILDVVSGFSDGILAEEINKTLGGKYELRTLQRRLAFLVKSNRLLKKGERKGVRYCLPPEIHTKEASGFSESATVEEGTERKTRERKPVRYNQDFLDKYQPNETYYLSDEMRKSLRDIGQIPDQNQPVGTYAREILDRLLIDLSWNSSRLEGNTYSLLETKILLELGQAAEGKDRKEAQMILNHKKAIEFMVDASAQIKIDKIMILNLHALLSENLLSVPEACGRLRRRRVGIGQSTFIPLGIPQRIEECFEKILQKAEAIEDPYEQSFFIMVHIPYLQPFEDVNKRVSRIAANLPFIRHNLCPISFIDVSQDAYLKGILGVYEFNETTLLRDVFVLAYKSSSERYSTVIQSLGEPDPFRMRYREEIYQVVGETVRQKLGKSEAAKFVKKRAEELVIKSDMSRFIEVVETELLGLHEGNIARYRLRMFDFRKWIEVWE